MPKITSVEPQKKNPHRFNIYLDGEFAFGADEDLVVNRRLVVGKEIKVEDLEQILFEADVGKLMERMYRLFNIRQRSEREIRDYLRNLSFKRKLKGQEELSTHIINAVIELMKRKEMINDEQFAKSWVESRRKSKKKGKRALISELYQKGIDREIIEEVVNDLSSSISEEQIAKEALEKKLRSWRHLDPMEFRKKATEYLMRRGFDYAVVKASIEKYFKK